VDTFGVDIEPFEAAFGQPFVVVIFFVLHTGCKSDHAKVVALVMLSMSPVKRMEKGASGIH